MTSRDQATRHEACRRTTRQVSLVTDWSQTPTEQVPQKGTQWNFVSTERTVWTL